MDHQRGAAVAEQRMGAVTESHLFILELGIGLALSIDGKVLHIPGVVAIGIVESVLLALGIEMPAGGLEVGAIALGRLMKVDSVLARRKIVKLEL